MKEQSHKDEMSAAIRGDFRRLRERGVAATLAPRADGRRNQADVPAEPEATALEPDVGHEPEAASGSPLERRIEPEQASDDPVARPGFLARLLGR